MKITLEKSYFRAFFLLKILPTSTNLLGLSGSQLNGI
jgi:hypothetical protein